MFFVGLCHFVDLRRARAVRLSNVIFHGAPRVKKLMKNRTRSLQINKINTKQQVESDTLLT